MYFLTLTLQNLTLEEEALLLLDLPQTVQPADALEHLLLRACWHVRKRFSEHVEDVSDGVQLGRNESALRSRFHRNVLRFTRFEVVQVLLVGLLDDVGRGT